MTSDDSEPFELVRSLGRGGFAETYRARVVDEELRAEYGVDEVALKIPHDRKAERALRKDVELGALFHLRLKELQAKNLVRYLGFERFRGQIVMVMELEEGSLRGVLGTPPRQKALPVADVLRYAEDVLRGLAVIHGEHVVHRDIKPENILLRGRVAKVTDFGIGRMLDADQVASSLIGTPPYMSPEMLSDQGATFTTDLWSLGVMLYEMLAGQLPFQGRSIKTLLNAICSEEPLPLRQLRPELPEPLVAVVMKALAKDPEKRYGSALEMLEALAAASQRRVDPAVVRELQELREAMLQAEQGPSVEARLRELARRHPDEPAILQQLGEFLARCQRHGDAIAAFQQALAHEPKSGLLYWHLALAYQGARQKAKAAEALRRAMELDLDPSLRRHAGAMLKMLGGTSA